MIRKLPKGYTGNLARINLTNRKITHDKIDTDLLYDYIGGRGLNVKYLYDELKPGIDPLGEENKIIFGVGPCNGTILSGSQRFNVTSKSPLTSFLGDSNSGGSFGAELKYAGWDMIILEGRSDTPVYLWIKDETIEIRDAHHTWGKTVHEARRLIEIELDDPNVSLCTIGLAGENLVRFANIIGDIGRAAGRTGMGAVLGSKKVKAVAVRGSKGVKVADYEKLKALNDENNQNWATGHDGTALSWLTTSGVTVAWEPMQMYGSLPVCNFQSGAFKTNLLKALRESGHIVKRKSCVGCAIGCNMSYVVKTEPHAGSFGEALQLVHLVEGPKLGSDDIGLLLRIGMLTDNYAMDIMDATAMVSFVLECGQRGILNEDDVDGLKLEWGNANTIVELIDMIAHRRGIGEILAEGLAHASKAIGKGSENFAMHAKNQVVVARNARASKGWALQYATSSRGPCHVRTFAPEGYQPTPERQGVWPSDCMKIVKDIKNAFDPLAEDGKAEIVKFYDELRAFQDSMEVCRFSLFNVVLDSQKKSMSEYMTGFVSAVTGMNLTADDVMRIGERIINLERAFNVREGLTRKNDTLPKRMLKEPMPDGMAKGQVVNLDYMLDQYYTLRGWDKNSGIPENWKLEDLGLKDIIKDLPRTN